MQPTKSFFFFAIDLSIVFGLLTGCFNLGSLIRTFFFWDGSAYLLMLREFGMLLFVACLKFLPCLSYIQWVLFESLHFMWYYFDITYW